MWTSEQPKLNRRSNPLKSMTSSNNPPYPHPLRTTDRTPYLAKSSQQVSNRRGSSKRTDNKWLNSIMLVQVEHLTSWIPTRRLSARSHLNPINKLALNPMARWSWIPIWVEWTRVATMNMMMKGVNMVQKMRMEMYSWEIMNQWTKVPMPSMKSSTRIWGNSTKTNIPVNKSEDWVKGGLLVTDKLFLPRCKEMV